MEEQGHITFTAFHEVVTKDSDFGVLHQYNSDKVKAFWAEHEKLRSPHLIVVGLQVHTRINKRDVTEHLDVFIRVGTSSRKELEEDILSRATELRAAIKQWNLHNTPIAQSLRRMYYEEKWTAKRIAKYLYVIIERAKQHNYENYNDIELGEYLFLEGNNQSDKARHAFSFILLCDILGITRPKTRWELLSKDELPTYFVRNFVQRLK